MALWRGSRSRLARMTRGVRVRPLLFDVLECRRLDLAFALVSGVALLAPAGHAELRGGKVGRAAGPVPSVRRLHRKPGPGRASRRLLDCVEGTTLPLGELLLAHRVLGEATVEAAAAATAAGAMGPGIVRVVDIRDR